MPVLRLLVGPGSGRRCSSIARAQASLERVRHWIAGHTAALDAALILVIALLQIQKGLSALQS